MYGVESRNGPLKLVSRAAELSVLAALGIFVIPRTALAYIDPVSGSVLLQVLAAGLLAALFTIKRSWLGITTFLRRIWGRILRRG